MLTIEVQLARAKTIGHPDCLLYGYTSKLQLRYADHKGFHVLAVGTFKINEVCCIYSGVIGEGDEPPTYAKPSDKMYTLSSGGMHCVGISTPVFGLGIGTFVNWTNTGTRDKNCELLRYTHEVEESGPTYEFYVKASKNIYGSIEHPVELETVYGNSCRFIKELTIPRFPHDLIVKLTDPKKCPVCGDMVKTNVKIDVFRALKHHTTKYHPDLLVSSKESDMAKRKAAEKKRKHDYYEQKKAADLLLNMRK